jgi:hypothetical protein
MQRPLSVILGVAKDLRVVSRVLRTRILHYVQNDTFA